MGPVVDTRERAASLPTRVALALLRMYKLLLSPLFAGSCRFVPSCSTYARDAVVLHGAVKGSLLALWRLARCHPLCSGGLDQVPLPRRLAAGGESPRTAERVPCQHAARPVQGGLRGTAPCN